jgi:ABC-type phosphate/phosphonate transport system substrate-binding protein
MIASLPMYDLPETREATDSFWAALAKAYGVSGALTRGGDWMQVWREPNMLFSQTCGYPFTHEFKGRLTYIATPHYAAEGCEGPLYCSILFAREQAPLSTFKGKRACYNSRDSMSGFLALKLVFAREQRLGQTDRAFFSSSAETGSHVASLAAVQTGKADICAIDCVTVALLKKHRPSALQNMVEVARSPAVPGLPYVTQGGDADRLRDAVFAVMQDGAMSSVRDALLLRGASALSPQDYEIILEKENSINDLNML